MYALLQSRRYFWKRSRTDLADAGLYEPRIAACDAIARRVIDATDDITTLFPLVLLKRYMLPTDNGTATSNPKSVIELAVDYHALNVIGSNNFQRCINYVWRGFYLVEYTVHNELAFKRCVHLESRRFADHFNPERIRVPKYQNMIHLIISIVFLVLFTIVVNVQPVSATPDFMEWVLFIFVIAYATSELQKLWKAGRYIFGFWNAFNSTLYAFFIVVFILRLSGEREHSFNLLSCLAPGVYIRQLLYLDGFKFFGTMLIVLKQMLKESLVFFALLVIVAAGFLQAFSGLDVSDNGKLDVMTQVLHSMTQAVLAAPDFDTYDKFSPPYGKLLYYVFVFLVTVILLNILIALFNQAYSDITDNAVDEYLALYAQKTLGFIRAPDDNIFVAPFNLLEICFLLPLEPLLSYKTYQQINFQVMRILYAPCLLLIAFYETQFIARRIHRNKVHGKAPDENYDSDDDEANAYYLNDESDWGKSSAWANTVQSAIG